jgi:hypothetical protein
MRQRSVPPPVIREGLICEAIRRRRLLEFTYHGLRRIVAPYCHGVSTRGSELIRGVQVGGASRSGGFGFGKLWSVTEMTDVQVSSISFVPSDPNYNPDDIGMREIHCRI